MKVKFANGEVDIWKLMPGTVVRNAENKYGHIQYIHNTSFGTIMLSVVYNGLSVLELPSELEIHILQPIQIQNNYYSSLDSATK